MYIGTMPDITDLVPGGVLSDKQLRFAQEYLIDCNGFAAAVRAGYSEENAKYQARQNLQNPTISHVIAEQRKKLSDERHISASVIIDNLMETYSRAMQAEPVLEFDPEEKCMVPSGEWQFDGKTATRCMELIAKMLGYIDNKTKPGEENTGFSLTIVTQAVQLQLEKNGLTIDQQGNILQKAGNVSRETVEAR